MKIIELNGRNFEVIEQKFMSQATNLNALEYGQAALYYKAQKQNMQAQLNKALKRVLATASKSKVRQLTNALMQEITKVSSEDSKAQEKMAEKKLQQIEQMFNMNTKPMSDLAAQDLRAIINDVFRQMEFKEANNSSNFQYKDFSETYFKKVKTALEEQALNTSTNLGKSMQRLKQLKYGDNKTVYAQYLSFFTQQAINAYGPKTKKDGTEIKIARDRKAYVNALKGYFREEALENAYNKMFQDLISQTTGGKINGKVVKNVAANQTIVDLGFDFSVLDTIQNLSGKVYEGQAMIPESCVKIPTTISNQSFGAQIKSFNLDDPTKSFYSLGGNAGLRNSLLNYGPVGQTMLGNMLFMGEIHSIKEALGAENVIFIDGYKKYWMYDFIQAFRKKGLWLSLSARGKDWERAVTDKIVLYSYKKQKNKT